MLMEFVRPMATLSPSDANTSTMRPYGVWAVIVAWRLPLRPPWRAGRPRRSWRASTFYRRLQGVGRRLIAMSGAKVVHEIFRRGRRPGRRSLQLVDIGDGAMTCVRAWPRTTAIDGLTFTGSYDVGFKEIFRKFCSTEYPRGRASSTRWGEERRRS